MRASDSAYRVGGDEFMVLLPDEQAWEAFTFAQRLQRATDGHRTALSVTCGIAESIGVDNRRTDPQRRPRALRRKAL